MRLPSHCKTGARALPAGWARRHVAHSWADCRSWAETQAQTWFGAGAGQLSVGGVEIGWPLQIDAFEAFLRVAVAASGLSSDRDFSPLRLIRQQGYDRGLRAAAMHVQAARGRTGAHPSRVLFVSEVPTPSMLEPSIRVARELPLQDVAVAVADPRAWLRWRREGFDPMTLTLPWLAERRLVARGHKDAVHAWRAFLRREPHFTFAETDVTEASLSQLHRLVDNSAPWLPVERAALERALEKTQPSHIVVATDQHRIGRLAADEGRRAGSLVVVLQHGLPQTAIAYLPVVADRVAVWSEGVRSWFVEHGTPHNKVEVCGNPRLDDLAKLDRVAQRRLVDAQHGINAERRLLVPLSPVGTDTDLAVLGVALEAARRDRGLVVMVKLHPGRGEKRHVLQLISNATLPTQIRIAQHEPLVPLLLWADAAFVYRSTVALESIAARTPVIAADVAPRSIADDELASLDLPRARDANALAIQIAAIGTREGARVFFESRQRKIDWMAGPIDGASARRIAASLQ